jgi:hypothetical protein
MKKTICTTVVAIGLIFCKVQAQNVFPTGAGTYVGIGTTTPAAPLSIKLTTQAANPPAFIQYQNELNDILYEQRFQMGTWAGASGGPGVSMYMGNAAGQLANVAGGANYNTIIGSYAAINLTTASCNSALGTKVLRDVTTGSYNTAGGDRAMMRLTSGEDNVGFGQAALANMTTASRNVAIGTGTMGANTAGDNNTVIGAYAGKVGTYSGSVIIGYRAASLVDPGSNKLWIHNSSAAMPLIYGDFITGQLGLGTITPAEKLDVVGVIKSNNQLKIENLGTTLGETHDHLKLDYWLGNGISIKKTFAVNNTVSGSSYGIKVDVAGNENQYGIYSKTATGGGPAVSSAYYGESQGVYGEITTFKGKVTHQELASNAIASVFKGTMETSTSNTGGAVYGVNIENNVPATSVNATTAAFKANYAITGTNSYGLYFTGEGMNYVSGRLGIGKQIPDANAKLDVAGNIYSSGKIMIGVASPSTALLNDYSLAVNGSALFTKAVVKLNTDWPDYVFSKNYDLPTLVSIEKYINENSHLPGVASAKEIEKNGVDLGDNQAVLLKKVEELTLYLIDLSKEVAALKKENEEIKAGLKK